MPPIKTPRPYSSSLRQDQAQGTRRVVLEAARDLFVAQGYGATTIDQIAERAGVSRPTVFRAVGKKQMLLRTVREVALAGDDEPVAVAERPLTNAIRQEPDRHRAIELLAHHLTLVASRYAQIYEELRAAARSGGEDLTRLWETEEHERLIGARFWIDVLLSKGGSPRHGVEVDIDVPTAVDALWVLMAPDHFHRLVHQRGWNNQKYEKWLTDAIAQLVGG